MARRSVLNPEQMGFKPARLLPGTVSIRVTKQARQHHEVDAAQALMDGILVRHCTSDLLAERVRAARMLGALLSDAQETALPSLRDLHRQARDDAFVLESSNWLPSACAQACQAAWRRGGRRT